MLRVVQHLLSCSAALILLESPSHSVSSVSSVLKTLTRFPILSVASSDFKTFSARSKSTDGRRLHLWFDCFSEMFTDEEFYQVDCRLGQACLLLTSLEPREVYLGCDGVPKLREAVKIE